MRQLKQELIELRRVVDEVEMFPGFEMTTKWALVVVNLTYQPRRSESKLDHVSSLGLAKLLVNNKARETSLLSLFSHPRVRFGTTLYYNKMHGARGNIAVL